ncbi:MAG: MBL fold metallo-hydrolase [Balneolaceae bacterium]|nr:MBL fold metallo-hydrolase [Balneolaceae bacterium]
MKRSIVATGMLILCAAAAHSVAAQDRPASGEQSGKLGVEYIAHASFLLHYQSTSLLLDPFADKEWIGYSFPRGVTADAVFSTHPHYDHDGGIFLGREPYWEGEIPLYQDPESYMVGAFEITGIKGKHSDPYGKEFGQKNTIWIIEAGDIRLVHLGDNGPLNDRQVDRIGRVDLLMVPMDSHYHILKKEELEKVLADLDPRVIIPMHYKHPDLEEKPDRPKNLGPIAPVLEGVERVRYLESNIHWFEQPLSRKKHSYVVFRHSPDIKP